MPFRCVVSALSTRCRCPAIVERCPAIVEPLRQMVLCYAMVPMRLAVLGPSQGDCQLLRRRAQFALQTVSATRVLYLGSDSLVDQVVADWAVELVGQPACQEGIWIRAARDCPRATADQIDDFLQRERSLQRLREIQFLPDRSAKTVELVDRMVVMLLYDKANLTEEDLYSASIFVFGKSDTPIARWAGARFFVAPGPLSHNDGGLVLLHCDDTGPVATWYNPQGRIAHETAIVAPKKSRAKFNIQGAKK